MTKATLQLFELSAVIPTGQYANITPKLIYEAQNFDDAYAAAMPHLQKIERDFGLDGNNLRASGPSTVNMQRMKCFATGSEVWFEPISHTYYDDQGVRLMSGSTFAHQFEHEFNKEMIAPKSAGKLGLSTEEVIEYWQSKADISTTFGTSLHQALEHYGKWKDVCEADGKGTGLHPTIEPIVLDFFKDRGDEQAVYEKFVADLKTGRVGQIDRMVITGDKHCIIEDYKTNADLYKMGIPKNLKAPYAYLPNVPLSKYILQLSFYKAIMEAGGWTVDGIRVHWWNGKEWKTIDLKAVDIDLKQDKIDVSQIV